MSMTVSCPSCNKSLRIGEENQGKKMRCPSCQEVFKAPLLDDDAQDSPRNPSSRHEYQDDRPSRRDDLEDRPSRRGDDRPSRRDEDDRPSRRRDEDDRPSRRDEDDRPSRRRDEDDRPSRRSIRADHEDDYPRRAPHEKPPAVQMAGIMLLIGGIVSIVASCFVMLSFLLGSLGVCCLYPSYIYALVAGILAILQGAALMGENAHKATPGRHTAIMLIVCIINFDPISMVMGIVALVQLNSPEARDFFGER